MRGGGCVLVEKNENQKSVVAQVELHKRARRQQALQAPSLTLTQTCFFFVFFFSPNMVSI